MLSGYEHEQNDLMHYLYEKIVIAKTSSTMKPILCWSQRYSLRRVITWHFSNECEFHGFGFNRKTLLAKKKLYSIGLLKETFGNKINSKNGSIIWSPRSCNDNYNRLEHVKFLICAERPASIDTLEACDCWLENTKKRIIISLIGWHS